MVCAWLKHKKSTRKDCGDIDNFIIIITTIIIIIIIIIIDDDDDNNYSQTAIVLVPFTNMQLLHFSNIPRILMYAENMRNL